MLNKLKTPVPTLDRRDLVLALAIAVFGLVIYTLALAPDILYSDSGEFQTLAYTWGTTHPTGYPVYLVLARVVGLLPVNSPAWRISLVSALAAAGTLTGIYLITRHFTHRGGAVLASMALLMSYTFWSQSIIAEVYTPATLFIVIVLLALLSWWRNPAKPRWLLFVAGFLLTLGLGVHLFLMLIAPSVFLFVLWGVLFGPPEERGRWQSVIWLPVGVIAGLISFFLIFAFIDSRPTPTNFFATAMQPSRDAWNLEESDFDTSLKRFWISVSGVQWRDAMLPEDVDYNDTLATFFEAHLSREFTTPTLLLAIIGAGVALLLHRRLLLLVGSALVVAFIAGLVYHPGDKFIFYLPAYLMLVIFAGAGAGHLILWITQFIPSAAMRLAGAVILTVALVALCIEPVLNARLRAVETGQSLFVTENYVYPVRNLSEPRRAAECAASKIAEDDAYLVLEWRALYSIYYVTHVEQGRTGIAIREARPHGTDVITENLLAEIAEQVGSGRAVYVDETHSVLRNNYNLTPVGGCPQYPLFRMSARS